MKSKLQELLEEIRSVMSGSNRIVDALLPAMLFLLLNSVSTLAAAAWASGVLAVLLTLYRLWKRQPIGYALAGLATSLLAVAMAVWAGSPQGYFLPDMITNAMLALIALISLFIQRPMVAYTSLIARRWPAGWYWHAHVRPAYSEVTIAWAVFFVVRLALQIAVYQQANLQQITLVNLLSGWPSTFTLLILSYLYGTWRLRQLQGPSVQEFKESAPPPWQGQRRGF